jgi:hypothetical protein
MADWPGTGQMMNSSRCWAEYGDVISKWLVVAALACLVVMFLYLVFGPEPQEIFKEAHE